MSARFEIVRTAAKPQQWHARLIANGRTILSSEKYTRQVGAERAVTSALRVLSGGSWELRWNGDSQTEKVAIDEAGTVHDITVLYVDERTEATR